MQRKNQKIFSVIPVYSLEIISIMIRNTIYFFNCDSYIPSFFARPGRLEDKNSKRNKDIQRRGQHVVSYGIETLHVPFTSIPY